MSSQNLSESPRSAPSRQNRLVRYRTWLAQRILGLLAGTLVLTAPAVHGGGDQDFRLWFATWWKAWRTEHFEAIGGAQARLSENGSQLFQHIFTTQFAYKPRTNLAIGMHYTLNSTEPVPGTGFLSQHKLEFQVQPRFPLDAVSTIDLRSRLEIRWTPNRPGTQEVFRNRLQWVRRLRDAGRLKALFLSDEIFWDFQAGEFVENRLVPAGLRFRVLSNTDLTLSYLLQTTQSRGGWDNNSVVMTQLFVGF